MSKNPHMYTMLITRGNARWAFDCHSWTPTSDDLKIAVSCIQPEEKLRLAKYVFRDDFNASLIGRLLMRAFICRFTNVDYNKIQIFRDDRGKPFYRDPNRWIDFNVSHQGSYTVFAGCVTPTSSRQPIKVGVDVMKREYTGGKALNEFFRLMHKNFSTDEWETIQSYNTPQQKIESFMRHWCLKESYVKNIGVGITVDLSKISFQVYTDLVTPESVPVGDSKVVVDGTLLKNWWFEESLLDQDHCVVVSLNNPDDGEVALNEKFQKVTFEQIMEGSKPLTPLDEDYTQKILEKDYKAL